MALFDVPGWSVPSAPVAVPSKKRKRPSKQGLDDIQSAAMNVEKLMERLAAEQTHARTKGDHGGGVSADADQPSKKKRKRVKDRKVQQSHIPARGDGEQSAPKKKRKDRQKKTGDKVTSSPSPASSYPPSEPSRDALTSLQRCMKQSLDGARFRWINEKLYKSDGVHAHAMMREDPAVFDDYHKGFRRQVESWPSNPVSHYISTLSSYPPRTVIADLGCGDAALARALIPKGYTVMSFDLVSDRAFVIEADIFERLPLPGSEGDSDGSGKCNHGHGHVVDVVVCALSLMGTNWPNCIREAWRILRPNGELKIAEVASRFTDVQQFQLLVESFGFRHKSTDDSNTHFTLLEFEKIGLSSGRLVQPTSVTLGLEDCPRLLKYARPVSRFAADSIVAGEDNGSKERHCMHSECSQIDIYVARSAEISESTWSSSQLHRSEFESSARKTLAKNVEQPTRPLSPSREYSFGKAAAVLLQGIHDLSIMLGYEASRDLEETPFQGRSPIGAFTGSVIKPRVGLTPILRAGLDYSKLPASPPVDLVFILDPLIATGGTATAALHMITDWGIPVSKIKLLCILASEVGLKHVQSQFPGVEIWVAATDPQLTSDGLISPGLGDTGDRLNNTAKEH
ncbi:putative uracil phosphoribosyltransferase [Lactarius psammicola]|nr:putative uracil phosphoribosyltransferase [Lactarius psammicola]